MMAVDYRRPALTSVVDKLLSMLLLVSVLLFASMSGVHSQNVRLVGSTLRNEGRLEVYYSGVWGTVCDDFFDYIDAGVVCNSLGRGYGYKGTVIGNQYGRGNGRIWMDDVQCVGTETSVANCDHKGWGTHNCNHTEDVSVLCGTSPVRHGPLPNADNFFFVADSYLRNIYQVDATSGATSQLLPFGTASYPVALAYDSTAKLLYWTDNSAYNTINRYSLRTNRSTVIYRDTSIVAVYYGLTIDITRRKLYYADGAETGGKIGELSTSGTAHRVLIRVTNSRPRAIVFDGDNRLYWTDWTTNRAAIYRSSVSSPARESLVSSNLVQPNALTIDFKAGVMYWGDAKLDKVETANLDGTGRKILWTDSTAHYFAFTFHAGYIYMADWLSGYIWKLNTATRTVSVQSAATHFQLLTDIVFVHITNSTATTTPSTATPSGVSVRLAGSSSRSRGRLEVYYSGVWGTVCDDHFDYIDAGVVCNSLGRGYGYKGTVIKNRYGPGNGRILMDNVQCVGNETSIDDCDHAGWSVHNCNHTEDVAVSCGTSPVRHGPLSDADDFFIVADGYLRNIYQVDATSGDTSQLLPFGTASYPVALAYDSTAKLLYWTDNSAYNTINRYSLRTNSNRVIYRDSSGVALYHDLTIDVRRRKLYYADAAETGGKVGELSTDGTAHHVLINVTNSRPRAIVFDEDNRMLYWTDWTTNRAAIYRSLVSRPARRTLVSSNLVQPNALAIDFTARVMYWGDAKLDKIEKANLDGTGRKIVLSETTTHYFAFAFHAGNIYITDWTVAYIWRLDIAKQLAYYNEYAAIHFQQLNGIVLVSSRTEPTDPVLAIWEIVVIVVSCSFFFYFLSAICYYKRIHVVGDCTCDDVPDFIKWFGKLSFRILCCIMYCLSSSDN